jgi:stearoyl-CoA desaturase (delta-9 desaturase)
MHAWLSIFTGIVPREWVAVHRKHHQFSDKEGDPHSPYLLGLWNVFFLNAFHYRTAAADDTMVKKYTPDYKNTLVDHIPGATHGVFLGMGIFVLMFGWIWGIPLFLFQAVAYILLNSSINSICHMIGKRNFDNNATNVQWIALLTGGEGLHNNHHERPTSPQFAVARGEIDPAWPVIKLWEALGLAKVKTLSASKAA